MKKSRLMQFAFLLVVIFLLTSVLMVCCSLAEGNGGESNGQFADEVELDLSADGDSVLEVPTTVNTKKQLIVVPFTNQNYSKADAARNVEQTLRQYLQAAESTDMYEHIHVVTSSLNTYDTLREAGAALSFPDTGFALKDTVKKIQGILQETPTDMETVLLVLEGSNPTANDYKEWGKLFGNDQANVWYVVIETSTNKNNRTKIQENFMNCAGLNASGAVEPNQLVDFNDHIHFAWLNDFQSVPGTLLPLFNSLTGLQLQAEEKSLETGAYSFSPLRSLTREMTFFLQGDLREATSLLKDQDGNDVEYFVAFSDSMFSLIRLTDLPTRFQINHPNITAVASVSDIKSVNDLFSLELTKATSNNLERNSTDDFYLFIEDPEGRLDLLLQDMAENDLKFELVNDGNILAEMLYNNEDERERFEAKDVPFGESGQYHVFARVQLNDQEKLEIGANPFEVINTKPVVQYTGNDFFWINDLWNSSETNEFSIPLDVSDVNGDHPRLSFENNRDFIQDLGDVSINQDQYAVHVTPTDEAKTGTDFNISVIAYDGEDKSDPETVVFRLFDLTNEIEHHVSIGSPELDPENPMKNEEFTITLPLHISDECPCKEQLLSLIVEKCHWTMEIAKDSRSLSNEEMEWNPEKSRWETAYTATESGEFTFSASGDAGTDKWALGTKKSSLSVDGHKPEHKADASLNISNPAYETIELLGTQWLVMQDDQYVSGQLDAETLFKDEDKDPIKLQIQLTCEPLVSVLLHQDQKIDMKLTKDANALTVTSDSDTSDWSGETSAILRFVEPGHYTLSVTPQDTDGTGEPLEIQFNILSQMQKWIILGIAILILLLVVTALTLVIVHIAKPSFVGKKVHVSVSSPTWSQENVLDISLWKKKSTNMASLLSCVACPPDPALFEKMDQVKVKPTRKGIIIRHGLKANLDSDKMNVTEENPATFVKKQYRIEIAATLEEG